ncbi:glutamate ABC transporter substrate-binding protein [Nocardioides sp. SLBN-35]|uniref:glutamate ABC transporter substrate-binding protein n=1 Tax=Nocardioides sp. SLBN-35 TaxID=2768445 RepID=UPI00114E159A|nr:glutamate ABC transporter substrate-binding protein [Nocardioides sp. SLBN-35]TQK72167.1 amino acid ABC transporter substrate-binding protein (PAAT family) [Nocardioides sp. SLBN-35]
MKQSRARLGVTAAVLGLMTLAGCSYDATKVPTHKAVPAADPSPASCETTDADLRSYAPSKAAGDAVKRIRKAGVLKVGVSADTLLLGARNPSTNAIEGFDIDVANKIAAELGVKPQYRVINAGQRIELLENNEIDIVARNMTINCARWQSVAFSAEYYRAGQKVLVRPDTADSYAGPQDLAGLKVCAPTGTTSVDNIKAAEPDVISEPALTHTGCLVKFQQGQVDAITGDDTVLAGLVAQDKLYAAVPKQDAFTKEPYGIATNADDTDLVAFINAVLEDMRADGSWQASYDKWLKPYLLIEATQPQPVYGR